MQSRFGQVISGPIPNEPYPYMQQWNLRLEQQLTSNLGFQLGYVGSKGTHLAAIAPTSIDQLQSQHYSMGSGLPKPSAANPAQTVGQSLRPYQASVRINF